MKYKYKTSLIVITLLILLNVLTLIHYKLWSMANEEDYLAVNTSGCINIIYSDSQDVLMINPRSYSDEDGLSTIPNTITISNVCSTNEKVSLYLDVYEDSTISDEKLKVNINGDYNLDTSLLSGISKTMGSENIVNTYKLAKLEVAPNEVKRINFRVWLEHNAALSIDRNKFHSKYYVLSDKEDAKENFMETILRNNNIVENDGLIKYNDYYFFNGSTTNNNVVFADMNWKILGINKDDSVKLIYNDEQLQSQYNDKSNDERNVSYEDSKIKTFIDDFYNSKLINYDSFIKESSYCNDTSYTNTYYRIYYGAYARNYSDLNPSLDCGETDKDYGGSNNHKIGLITLDEASIAGVGLENNESNYLNDGNDYYTMSPVQFNYRAYVGIIDKFGKLDANTVNDIKEVRPVINIVNSISVEGSGTIENPYLVKIN